MTDPTITKPVTIEVPEELYDRAHNRAEGSDITAHEILIDHVDFEIEWVPDA